MAVGAMVGGRLSPGVTVMGSVNQAVLPLESLRSLPSVTSTVTEEGPE